MADRARHGRAPATVAGRARAHLFGFLLAVGGIGAGVSAREQADFLRAVAAAPPATVAALYWQARITLLRRVEDVEVFDAIFAAWFGDADTPQVEAVEAPDDDETAAPQPSDEGDLAPADAGEGTGLEASAADLVTRADFAATPDEQRRALALLRRDWPASLPRVRTRRLRPARRGARLDARRSGRAATRTGGEILDLAWRRRPSRPRRLLVLVDVSGSMESTSADLLRVAQVAVATCPQVEVLTFGTRLTRVTEPLRRHDVDLAMAGLGELVADAHGGTRIGVALETFLGHHHLLGLARGALVIVASDGLERGECGPMIAATERLSRLAHRLVWWSPLACDPAYRPVTRGMAAVLGHLDHLGGVRDVVTARAEVRRLPAISAGPRHTAAATYAAVTARSAA